LDFFDIDAAAAAKLFGKKFACGSAFQKGKNGGADQVRPV
jgi:translation initiation factor 1 (eIF-1/SUI1)